MAQKGLETKWEGLVTILSSKNFCLLAKAEAHMKYFPQYFYTKKSEYLNGYFTDNAVYLRSRHTGKYWTFQQ